MPSWTASPRTPLRKSRSGRPRTFHPTPIGSSWLNQTEIRFGILTRQSIRHGAFSGVHVLTEQIRDYVNSRNQNAESFTRTATAVEIRAKARLTQTKVRKLAK